MCNNIEPLTPALWFQRIAIIASGDLGNIENSLRHAGHLIQLAPIAFRRVLPATIDEDEFEELLGTGAFDAAARQLFAPAVTLLLETETGAESMRAVIPCSLLKRKVDGSGDTTAGAMLNAWANWLIALRLEFGIELEDPPASADDWGAPLSKSACPGAK